jgi:hypothetical protein
MRLFLRRLAVMAVLSTSVMATTAPAQATNVESFHLLVTGVAYVLASTCPFDPPPAPETVCDDFFVVYSQEGHPNEQVRRQPWSLFIDSSRYVFHGPDEPVTVLRARTGQLEGVSGFVDTTHLLTAVVATSVPMSDGSTFEIDLHWDMSGSRFQVAGTDGPIQEPGFPWGSHFVSRCTTENWHAHQTWREGGQITGNLDGTDAASLSLPDFFPSFVGRGVFTINISSHGPGCL